MKIIQISQNDFFVSITREELLKFVFLKYMLSKKIPVLIASEQF